MLDQQAPVENPSTARRKRSGISRDGRSLGSIEQVPPRTHKSREQSGAVRKEIADGLPGVKIRRNRISVSGGEGGGWDRRVSAK
ncbi:hypothetical protein N7528_001730 [Penicillium herquei]|nr:hypothetical protein N7528_001730 [Penicillium herquei]